MKPDNSHLPWGDSQFAMWVGILVAVAVGLFYLLALPWLAERLS